ncbi:tektin-1 [Austrofundulus limnaeus]|uniref:Tektin n=1 Tax=Austrofundulus limnaeus TaxID=52670 RepID=A0A2I4CGK9_AUSLI|nr:PREDICTED: tektin-1 [Austrofundulus limnaeus]
MDHRLQEATGPDPANMDVMLNLSEEFRAKCKTLMEETSKACKRLQDEDSRHLNQRVRDIQFLQKEMELKLGEIILEADVLVALQSRVMKALEVCKESLRVNILCQEDRKKHTSSERQQDEVNKELLKEKKVTEDVASLLERVAEQVSEQIRLNRSTKYHLERDLKEIFEAQNIDNPCALMTVHSNLTQEKPKDNCTEPPSVTVTPKQWENISDLNIAKAVQQKTNSMSLRTLVESVLQQTAADVQKQFQATTVAFQLYIHQVKFSKDQMEEKLSKILSEITAQQLIRQDLQASITENEHFLSLAQARWSQRHQSPGKKQFQDPAQVQLRTEIQQLTAHIKKLREEMAQSEKQEIVLFSSQQKLQESIDIKANSLYTDEVLCKQHRESIIIFNF